jgi:Tol biopolymer transport system component
MSRDDNEEVYVMDADGGNQTNLTKQLGRRPRSGLVATAPDPNGVSYRMLTASPGT